MNPQPVSLADELRGALARGYCHAKNSHKVLDGDLIEAMREEVETLLRQHAVAEPQRVLTEHQRKVEEAAGMPIDWGMANASTVAHAAEQPKLTADICECLRLALEWNDDYMRLNNLHGKVEWCEWARKLLTSPVAPPPDLADEKLAYAGRSGNVPPQCFPNLHLPNCEHVLDVPAEYFQPPVAPPPPQKCTHFICLCKEEHELRSHVETCKICSAASAVVDDFCEAGKLLFEQWGKMPQSEEPNAQGAPGSYRQEILEEYHRDVRSPSWIFDKAYELGKRGAK